MTKIGRRRFATLLLTSAICGGSRAAEPFASKPIKIIVPYGTGGLSDFVVRTVGEPMARRLNQPLIVDYRSGASGAIGAQFVAAAPPDGYTQLFANNALVITRYATFKPLYDATTSFAPVGLISRTPMLILTNSSVPADTLQEFIGWAKAQPKGVEYGTAGVLSLGHVTAVRLARATGMDLVHVPYKGGGPMTLALRSNETRLMITTASSDILGFVDSGQFKLLAVAGREPMPRRPGVPLVSSTVPGFEAEAWYGLFAPAGTPVPVISALSSSLQASLADSELREKFARLDHVVGTGTPDELRAIVRSDTELWSRLIPELGIKLD